MGHAHARARSRVELNVGGKHFTTSVTTLRSKPGTMLDAMFRWPQPNTLTHPPALSLCVFYARCSLRPPLTTVSLSC
jgi:hypothetical protein